MKYFPLSYMKKNGCQKLLEAAIGVLLAASKGKERLP
jgi:hypothetical protein